MPGAQRKPYQWFVAVVITCMVIAAVPANAISYGGIGGRPAYPQPDNPRTSDIFVHTIEPGERVQEGVLVINNREEAKDLYVYSADVQRSTEGGFACKQLLDVQSEVGTWITFGTPQDAIAITTTPEEDPDRDGLVAADELKYGTNVLNADTDGDGFLDGTEVFFGYNPVGEGRLESWVAENPPEPTETADDVTTTEPVDPTQVDTDGDGLTDEQERQYATNPQAADTDNDGTSDAEEIAAGTDPLQPILLTLANHSNKLIPFTITVPENASVGEQDGCVLIQEKRPEDTTGSGIKLATRTGLRVAITVPGDIIRELVINNLLVQPRARGGKILHPIIENIGNVSIDADVKVITKSMFGRIIMEHGGQYSILRDDTGEWNFELDPPFWGGWYRAYLSVTYDPHLEAGTGVESGQGTTTLTWPVVWFFMMPSVWALIIYAAILLLIIALIIFWIIYRRRKQWIQETWQEYTVQPGDDIRSIAEQYDVSWKLLAKVNGLRPPYTLHPGMVIKVPPPAQ